MLSCSFEQTNIEFIDELYMYESIYRLNILTSSPHPDQKATFAMLRRCRYTQFSLNCENEIIHLLMISHSFHAVYNTCAILILFTHFRKENNKKKNNNQHQQKFQALTLQTTTQSDLILIKVNRYLRLFLSLSLSTSCGRAHPHAHH